MDSISPFPPRRSGVSSWTPDLLREAAFLALFFFGNKFILDVHEVDPLIHSITAQTSLKSAASACLFAGNDGRHNHPRHHLNSRIPAEF